MRARAENASLRAKHEHSWAESTAAYAAVVENHKQQLAEREAEARERKERLGG